MSFSVYVHVPYCRVQCPYCTFYTLLHPAGEPGMRRFLGGVRREWDLRVGPRLRRGERLATLYLGGGTPSDLPVAEHAAFLRGLGADLPGGLAGLDEATVECNPESATPELLDALREAGIGRASLGVQALDDRDLRWLGRASNSAQNRAALRHVAARFPTWNADLILGVPGSGVSRLVAALGELSQLGAPHISFYCLEMPPGRAHQMGDPPGAGTDARKARLYENASAWVEAHGYEHYEISNAARPGHRARHNTAYWLGSEYVGLGPGAHSFEAGERRANVPDLSRWLGALESGVEPPARREMLTEELRAEERLLLGLRLREGLLLADPVLQGRAAFLKRLERTGLARLDAARLRLTARGWLVSDSIVVQLLAPHAPGGDRIDKPGEPSLHWSS